MHQKWDFIRFLESEPAARRFLSEAYSKHNHVQPERLAFMQSTRFCYTWKQARTFYETAATSNILVRPLLLFYGCVHLFKGLCIVKDPQYPQNSRVLQHGVTTRKVKRVPYHLLADEIRPQKEGLFSLLAQMMIRQPLYDKYHVKQLFSYIPDLWEKYEMVVEPAPWVPIIVNEQRICFPKKQKGVLTYSPSTFVSCLNRYAPSGIQFDVSPHEDNTNGDLTVLVRSNGSSETNYSRLLTSHPLFSLSISGQLLFWNDSEETLPLPVWAAHYLLLYTLGTLCRYEVEHWGDLVLSHSHSELYLIEQFLRVHEKTFPMLMESMLTSYTPV